MIHFPESFAFITDEVSQDPADVVRFAARHGIRRVEVRSAFGRQFRELSSANVAELRLRFADAGLSVVACDTPVFKCPLSDQKAIEAHRAIFQRSVEIAEALGAPLLRVFTFLRDTTSLTDARLEILARELGSLLPLLPNGITVGVENEASCQIATAEETALLLEHLPSPLIGVVWDPCNVLYVPGLRQPPSVGFTTIARRVAHVHAKDAIRTTDGASATPLGAGEVDWAAEFRALHIAGYTGVISLETHWRQAALAEDALHLPGGHAFSHGGEAASEVCLQALPALLAQGAT